MKRLPILLLACLVAVNSYSQNVTFRSGFAKPIYDGRCHDLLFEGGHPLIHSADMKVGFRDYSDSVYAVKYKHPEFGLGLCVDFMDMVNYNTGSQMSNFYSLYGYFDRPIFSLPSFEFGYTTALGAAYTREVFDPLTNPNNQLVSTHIVCHFCLGLQAKYTGMERFDLGLGFYFCHSSNGSVKMFNNGLNILQVGAFVTEKNPNPLKKDGRKLFDIARADFARGETEFRPHFVYDIQFALGFAQPMAEYYLGYADVQDPSIQRAGWSAQAKYMTQADVMYKYSEKHASGIGLDLFYCPFSSLLWHMGHGEKMSDYGPSGYDPFSVAVSLRHEFMYHNLALECYYGFYLYNNDGQTSKNTYQGLSLRYYFPRLANLYAGVLLKAHSFNNCESTQILIGKRF